MLVLLPYVVMSCRDVVRGISLDLDSDRHVVSPAPLGVSGLNVVELVLGQVDEWSHSSLAVRPNEVSVVGVQGDG